MAGAISRKDNASRGKVVQGAGQGEHTGPLSRLEAPRREQGMLLGQEVQEDGTVAKAQEETWFTSQFDMMRTQKKGFAS